MINKIIRWIFFIIGLVIVSIGIAFTIQADLGVGPWDVFHLGVTNFLPISVGRASQLTGLVIIILSYLLAEIKPSLGTIINMLLVGFIMDAVLLIIPKASVWIMQYFYLLVGILIMGSGIATYISAACGTGPRDSMMVALDKKFKVDLWLIRNGMELSVLVMGFLMGGPVGIGTVLAALGIGPAVDFSFRVIKYLSKSSLFKSPLLE